MYSASSLARNVARPPISSGRAICPKGTDAPTTRFFSPGFSLSYLANIASTWSQCSLSTTPGAMPFTLMRCLMRSRPALCVRLMTAAFFTYVTLREPSMNARASTLSARIRTMEEFSVASGISRPTLSRFFNDPGRVRPTTRQKIEAAMDRLGYRPNLFAINFNRRNTKTVGIIVPTLLDPFYAALVQRIEFQALEAGYWSVIQSSQGDPDREAEAVATLVSTKSAGAVVVPLGAASRKNLYRQMEKAMPLVFLDARVDADGAFVGTDNHFSMNLMVDYLLRSGAPPSYFDMPAVNQNASERRRAYELSMLE